MRRRCFGFGSSTSSSLPGSAASGGGTRLDRGARTPGTCACGARVGTDAAAVAGVLRNALRKSIDLAICTKTYHSKGSRVFSHGGETPDSVLQGLVARAKACLREVDEGEEEGRSWKAVRDRSRRRGALPKDGTAGAGADASLRATTSSSSAAKRKRVAASMLVIFHSINLLTICFAG